MDIRAHNRAAWNRQVEKGNRWTVPVGPEEITRARDGEWRILLTPTKPVPRAWLGTLRDAEVLCLASGGGQQGPILAAAGARVVVLDNSPAQLAQDQRVAEREGLAIRLVEGDMADLSVFPGASFDLIIHPVSNNFVPDVRQVWREASRVLRGGGALLAGFGNPVIYIFDSALLARGQLEVRHALPYADVDALTEAEKARYVAEGEPFEFSHTLEDQIGGQIAAGLAITGFYEDRCTAEDNDLLSRYMPTFIATRAIKG